MLELVEGVYIIRKIVGSNPGVQKHTILIQDHQLFPEVEIDEIQHNLVAMSTHFKSLEGARV